MRSKRKLAVGLGRVRPFSGVDDQAIAEIDELLGRGLTEGRAAAPAQEDRQPRDEEGHDDARRSFCRRPPQMELDHLRGDVPALSREREREDRDLRVDPIVGIMLGKEQHAPRGVPVAEPRERLYGRLPPLRRNPGEMRHHARP